MKASKKDDKNFTLPFFVALSLSHSQSFWQLHPQQHHRPRHPARVRAKEAASISTCAFQTHELCAISVLGKSNGKDSFFTCLQQDQRPTRPKIY
jgi:hypothetical protein